MINSTLNKFHTSVLLQETIDALKVKPGAWYVDATVGGGGHSLEILNRGGKVLGIDQDNEALEVAETRLKLACPSGVFRLVKANFKDLAAVTSKEDIQPLGIVFDLGVSSFQLGGNERGFSFQANEPLDMRMDPQNQNVTAKDLLNGLYEKELEKLITEYGEDPLARRIARAIVRARNTKPIETTGELAALIAEVYNRTYRSHSRLNPATKTFQALRIAVNDEMDVLQEGLEAAITILQSRGRCAVISFHGLEDRIVKQTFLEWEEQKRGQRLTEKPIVPGADEVSNNPRSRSAKLRVFEKTAHETASSS